MAPFEETEDICVLLDGSNGTLLSADVPFPNTLVGKIQYRATLGTTSGAFPFTYPSLEMGGNYYEFGVPYRAGFGSAILAVLMFAFIATMVWGGLGYTLKAMFDDERDVLALPPDMKDREGG